MFGYLKSSSKFRSVDSFTFNTHRPTQPDQVIQSLNYQPEFQKDVGLSIQPSR